jgi:hypothetical protein
MYLKSILAAAVMAATTANAATTIYFEDGGYYELADGEELYVSKGRVWEFTRFLADDLRIEQLEPFTPGEQCSTGFTFGGSSCTTSTPVTEEVEIETETTTETCGLTFGGGC